MLTHMSLFTGIGGIDLAAEWAGFETVGQCEFADFPTKILEKHWPEVVRWRDVRELTAQSFRERTGIKHVTLLSGGFPCQPFSVAGKQKGKEDNRYLWPEMLRVIREIRPTWVLGENVPGILKIAGRTVCEDLEREGYDITVFNFEAAAVGAPHKRERVFFVGHAKHNGFAAESKLRGHEAASCGRSQKQNTTIKFAGTNRSFDVPSLCRCEEWTTGSGDVSYPSSERWEEINDEAGNSCKRKTKRESWTTDCPSNDIWSVEPNVGRVAHGVSDRVDRLKCLGNAVVPQQVYPILKAIAELSKVEKTDSAIENGGD